MSIPESASGEGKFSLAVKAEELASYTTKITVNQNVFLPEYQGELTNDIVAQAKEAYLLIGEANGIKVVKGSDDALKNFRERRRIQKETLRHLRRLLKLIDLAHRVFHLSRKRVKYWGGMVIMIRDRTQSWMESDMKRFSDEEQ